MTLNGMVKVNNVARKDENFPLQVFDTLSLEKGGLNYRLEIVNRKFALKEIKASEAGSKIVKISGKKILRSRASGGMGVGGMGVSEKKERVKSVVQMNLDDGQNVLGDAKFNVGDSVVLDTSKGVVKVVSVLALKVGAKVEVIAGKHAGEKGELVGFEELVRGRDYKIKLEDGHEVSLPFRTILVIG